MSDRSPTQIGYVLMQSDLDRTTLQAESDPARELWELPKQFACLDLVRSLDILRTYFYGSK